MLLTWHQLLSMLFNKHLNLYKLEQQVDTHYVGYELSLSYRTIELYIGSNVYMHIFKAGAHRCQMSPS